MPTRPGSSELPAHAVRARVITPDFVGAPLGAIPPGGTPPTPAVDDGHAPGRRGAGAGIAPIHPGAVDQSADRTTRGWTSSPLCGDLLLRPSDRNRLGFQHESARSLRATKDHEAAVRHRRLAGTFGSVAKGCPPGNASGRTPGRTRMDSGSRLPGTARSLHDTEEHDTSTPSHRARSAFSDPTAPGVGCPARELAKDQSFGRPDGGFGTIPERRHRRRDRERPLRRGHRAVLALAMFLVNDAILVTQEIKRTVELRNDRRRDRQDSVR